jgi:hypothetical protein
VLDRARGAVEDLAFAAEYRALFAA